MSTNNNDHASIHEFDFNLICEYFSSITHQGPGSEESTALALQFVNGLNEQSKIADLGCGTGSQTLSLAKHSPCQITALDLFPQFVDKLNTKVKENRWEDRIQTIVGSMADLPFQEEEFDVIWSEGAIYNIGFKRGLAEWKKFLKPNGFLAVTESTWFTEERPDEIERFWMDAYPEIDTIAHNIQTIQSLGYKLIAAFPLPEKCWTENFYVPQIEAQRIFLSKHRGNAIAEGLVQNQRHEAELYSRYKEFYGYVFYIAQKM